MPTIAYNFLEEYKRFTQMPQPQSQFEQWHQLTEYFDILSLFAALPLPEVKLCIGQQITQIWRIYHPDFAISKLDPNPAKIVCLSVSFASFDLVSSIAKSRVDGLVLVLYHSKI